MSAAADLQAAIEERLAMPGVLSVTVPIVKRRTMQMGAEIEAAVANHGLCVLVLPPLPTRAEQGLETVFFAEAEVRVRIVEAPALNTTGKDAYDLLDEVAVALHWQLFGSILSHPLYLASRPAQEHSSSDRRMLDVIFVAVYGLAAGS